MNVCEEDSEDEWEEEEQLVVVHLSGIIDPEYLKKCDPTNCRILGIETEQPVLQIDKMCFHGSYADSVGTNIIFEEKGNVVDGKEQKELKYMCNTTKNLDMIRVFFKREDVQKKETGEGSQGTTASNNDVENRQKDETQEISEVVTDTVDVQESVADQELISNELQVPLEHLAEVEDNATSDMDIGLTDQR